MKHTFWCFFLFQLKTLVVFWKRLGKRFSKKWTSKSRKNWKVPSKPSQVPYSYGFKVLTSLNFLDKIDSTRAKSVFFSDPHCKKKRKSQLSRVIFYTFCAKIGKKVFLRFAVFASDFCDFFFSFQNDKISPPKRQNGQKNDKFWCFFDKKN